MKKIIRKFWGVALVVMMMSSLLIATVPASAGNYAFSDSLTLPNNVPGDNTLAAAGNGFIDVAKAGDTIYAIGMVAANTLYKSSDGGLTWAAAVAGGLPATGLWKYVAVAPDDPLIVVVVNNLAGFADTVYLSTNGGATFNQLNATTVGTEINTVDISPLSSTGARYIAVGGSSAATGAPVLETWTLGGFSWTALPPIRTGVAPGVVYVYDDVVAIKYVPTFASEEDLLVVTEIAGAAGSVYLHIYSYPSAYNGWNNTAVDPSYPKLVETLTAAGDVVNRATLELDDTYMALVNEVGFIGASIVAGGLETGGIYSVAGTGATPQIFTTTGVNSLAWDGINLMAAPYQVAPGPITIYRSSTALSATPIFSLSTAVKTPGTGTLPLVIFSGGDGYAFSRGANSAIARTTDLGRSFNGIKYVNSDFSNMIDFWISSDASVMYAITDDGVSTNALWRKNAGVWERVLIFTGASYGVNWLVRAADSDPTAVFLARKGARNVVYSLDNGDFTWTTRFSQQNIADLAAMSAGTIYYVSDTGATGAVFKGTVSVSAIAWTNLGALTGAVRLYNITLAGDGFVVGGLTGAVGYYNGTVLATAGTLGTGPVVVAASGTADGDVIWAASATTGGVNNYTIGTSTAFSVTPITAASGFTGVAYANGVAYAYDDTLDRLYRYIPGAAADIIAGVGTEVFDQTNMVNALQVSMGSNTLWARNSATAPDTIQSYTEFLLLAIPSLTYPVAGEIIPVNSINGVTNPFIFQWAAPAGVTAPLAGWTYTVSVFFDQAGTIAVAPAVVRIVTNAPSTLFNVGGVSPFTAGETYYWRVQVTGPITSLPSESPTIVTGTFTVQQLEAVVPVIDSPPNGSNVASLTPAFSWGPISGVTKYEFQIAKEPEFALMVYTANSSTSSAALPVATQLEDGETYFWRVRAIEPAVGEWSQVGIFTVAVPVTPPVTVTPTVTATTTTTVITTPTIIIPTTTQAPVEKISPAYIWAIIIIGAVLVIAVIVLIVRTRRTV